MELLTGLTVIAAEGIPPGSPTAVLAVPLAILVFLGSIYLLLRANLGTRRGYLVMGTSFFGFMIILSAFWTFGAPGTPQATGPQNLPGQPSGHYEPGWTPFAIDSRIAEDPRYQFVQQYPQDFGDVPEDFQGTAQDGVGDIAEFFSAEAGGQRIADDWEAVEVEYARAPNNDAVIAATFAPPGDAPGEPETLFAFYDPGAPLFPSFVFIGLSVLGFAVHAFLLSADEARERREGTEVAEERERVPAGA